jgi:DNA-binding winged helix-turn-helix (wHTH) protein
VSWHRPSETERAAMVALHLTPQEARVYVLLRDTAPVVVPLADVHRVANTRKVIISNIRSRLRASGSSARIENIHGRGYMLVVSVTDATDAGPPKRTTTPDVETVT